MATLTSAQQANNAAIISNINAADRAAGKPVSAYGANSASTPVAQQTAVNWSNPAITATPGGGNLTNYAYSTGMSSAQGQALNAIPANQIGQPVTQPAIPAPAGTPAATYNNLVTQGNAQLSNPTYGLTAGEGGQLSVNPVTEKNTAGMTDLQSFILGKLTDRQTPSSENALMQAQNQSGILQARQAVNQYAGQLNDIVNKSQAAQIAALGQGRGIPEVIIGGQQAQIAREAAIQALPIQAQLAAAQGNLELAQSQFEMLFKVKSEDAKNKFDYETNVLNLFKDYADKEQQNKLDDLKMAKTQAFQVAQSNRDYARNMSLKATSFGQAGLAGMFAKLDENSPSFNSDVAKLQSQLSPTEGWTYKELPDGRAVMLDAKGNIMKEVSQAAPSKAQQDAEIAQEQTKQMIPSLMDKINKINDLISSESYKKVVGTAWPGRTPIISAFTGEAQNAIGDIKQLISQETLDRLINLKKAGGTLGALSDQERIMLQNAATKLGAWEIKDANGMGVGRWDASEKDFKTELEQIRTLAQRAVNNAGGITADNPLGLPVSGNYLSSDTLNLGI